MEMRTGLTMTAMVIGVALVLAGALMSYRAFAESSYISATGKALSSEVRKVTTSLSGSTTRTTTWKLFVDYEYWIGGEHFVSDRVASSQPSSNAIFGGPSDELQELAHRFEAGRAITVFVSADNPARAVLLKASYGGLRIALVGVVFLAVGGLAYFRIV